MNLEQQVVSLNLAKQLKELGVKQESLFYWIHNILMYQTPIGFVHPTGAETTRHNPIIEERISAFTVAELGEMLPRGKFTKIESFHRIAGERPDGFKWPDGWYVRESLADHLFEANTEADCRAKMLCYLLENKLI